MTVNESRRYYSGYEKRKVPEDAPINFISNRWQKHVYDDDGTINRHYYEMVVLTKLRNYVGFSNVSIVGSRQHKDFEEYLVSKADWNSIDSNKTRLAVSLSAKAYLEERTETLLQRYYLVKIHSHKRAIIRTVISSSFGARSLEA